MATERTRETRADETQTQRRRRQPGTIDRMDHFKLAIPDAVQESNPDHAFRWVLDTPQRIHQLTKLDDWDKVEGVDAIPDHADKHGKQINLVLVKKRREFWDEDQRAKFASIREDEKALLTAPTSDPLDDRPKDVSYVPDGNRINQGLAP